MVRRASAAWSDASRPLIAASTAWRASALRRATGSGRPPPAWPRRTASGNPPADDTGAAGACRDRRAANSAAAVASGDLVGLCVSPRRSSITRNTAGARRGMSPPTTMTRSLVTAARPVLRPMSGPPPVTGSTTTVIRTVAGRPSSSVRAKAPDAGPTTMTSSATSAVARIASSSSGMPSSSARSFGLPNRDERPPARTIALAISSRLRARPVPAWQLDREPGARARGRARFVAGGPAGRGPRGSPAHTAGSSRSHRGTRPA